MTDLTGIAVAAVLPVLAAPNRVLVDVGELGLGGRGRLPHHGHHGQRGVLPARPRGRGERSHRLVTPLLEQSPLLPLQRRTLLSVARHHALAPTLRGIVGRVIGADHGVALGGGGDGGGAVEDVDLLVVVGRDHGHAGELGDAGRDEVDGDREGEGEAEEKEEEALARRAEIVSPGMRNIT